MTDAEKVEEVIAKLEDRFYFGQRVLVKNAPNPWTAVVMGMRPGELLLEEEGVDDLTNWYTIENLVCQPL